MQATTPKPTPSDLLIAALNELLRAEVPAVNLLAAASPWLAPIFPAAYTWHNVTTVMLAGDTWHPWVAFAVGGFVAVAVEAVGISAVHSVIGMWGERGRETLVRLAGGALGMYLLIVVGANVALDWNARRDGVLIAASGLLCMMTVTGGIIAGVRARAQRAAADEQERAATSAKLASDRAAADALIEAQEVAHWDKKLAAEAEAQRAQREHDARMAELTAETERQRLRMEHELQMAMLQKQAKPTPPAPRERKVSKATGRNADLKRKAHELKTDNPNMENKDIANFLNVHPSTVGRWLSENGEKE